MKKTKLICTIGPTSEDRETLRSLMGAGMDAARLNFSHGSHEEHKAKIDLVKELREELDIPMPIILDTKGPEIRTGRFKEGGATLKEDQEYTITTEDILGDETICSTSYEGILGDVNPGDRILIDDGLIEMTVNRIDEKAISCVVNNGGEVKDNKGVNIPGVNVQLPALTQKDREDIAFGIREGVDFVAASFVRKAKDVEKLREFLSDNNGSDISIISKIENAEGIENIDDIIDASDGVMVARGDLGVEIPPEEVPWIQKQIIKKCNIKGKFVITATQMMDSMMRNPRPTRAEVADVANAILDGSDVVMLSGETAMGKYPLESVEMMTDVALAAEDGIDYDGRIKTHRRSIDTNVTNAIGYSTCSSAESLDAKAIITPTVSGYTAQVVSRFRPKSMILAFSSNEKVVRRLSLSWGVVPFFMPYISDESEFFTAAIEKAKETGYIEDKDIIVLTAGVPLGIGGTTNMMRIHEVGKDY